MSKRILVTGAAGKVGRVVVRDLLDHGYSVEGLDVVKPESPDSSFVVADMADFGELFDVMRTVDAVIHLGAINFNRRRAEHVFFRDNTLGTYHVFHAAAALGFDRVVWASSETIFGLPMGQNPPDHAPLTEDSPARCNSGYALSKLLGEDIGANYHKTHGIASAALRFTNVMGPGDYERFTTWQDDPSKRAWNMWGYVDVRDCAQACRLAMETPLDSAHVLNITADDTAMKTPSADLMAAVFPDAGVGELPHPRATLISSERAKRVIGYRPQHDWQTELGG